MKTRKILYADEGMILTDGDVYGTQIFLAEGVNEKQFYEITKQEYEKIMNEESYHG